MCQVDNIYYYQDELGSTSHIADGTGALIESYQYDVYGKPRVYNASDVYQAGATPVAQFLQGGARWMPELGLYDDRNRFMSPDLGRFIQPDPIGFKGDASNLYRYCGNDWANKTDPMGLEGYMSTALDNTSLTSKEVSSALEHQSKPDDHTFQSKWSGDEVKYQANVDSQHAANMRNAKSALKDFADAQRFSLKDPQLTIMYKPGQGSSAGDYPIDMGHAILETPHKYLDFDTNGFHPPSGTEGARDNFSGFKTRNISVKPNQMALIEKRIDLIKSDMPHWGFGNNCSTQIGFALRAGGIQTFSLTPRTLWNTLPSDSNGNPP